MATVGYGGEHPLVNIATGLKLTVEPPDGTSAAAPVNQGDILELDPADTAFDGVALKTKQATGTINAVDQILVQALAPIRDVALPLGVLILAPGVGIRTLPYQTAPTVGQSVQVVSGQRAVAGIAYAKGKGLVISVDTASLTCEVLF